MSEQILGAQYYRPPNPPREDWDRDLGRMRAAGLTTVKYWACWGWGEVDDLDELMGLAAKHGLGVVLNTILENAPYELAQQYPQARYLDHEERAVALTAAMNTPGGGWPGLCFDLDGVWAAAAGYLRSLVVRYRSHPALRVWDVWNEPHLEPASYFPDRLYCYCPASLAAFHRWLRARYPSLDELNTAWARRFTDWAQVEPPRRFEAVPDMLDWRSFWFDNLRGWLTRRADLVRSLDADHPVMTHVALSGFTGQLATHTLDEYALTAPVDLFGTSSFPTWLMGDDHVEHLFNLDTARDAASPKPFWQAELQGGRGRRDGPRSTAHPDPAAVKLWIWNSLAAGASGVMFWQWRPELLGPEAPGYGLCTPDGRPTARVEAVTEVAPIATHPALAGRTPVRAETALLVSRRAALHAFATDRSMQVYRQAVLGAYRVLSDADIPVTVLHEDQVTASGVPPWVTRVYWPMPSVCDADLADAFVTFVDGGGHLVAEASPGEYTAMGFRRPGVPGGALEGLFGVRQIDADAVLGPVASGPLRGAWQRERVEVHNATLVHDGDFPVTRRTLGAGTATLIGSYPSLAGSSFVDLLGPSPLRPVTWMSPRPGLVSRSADLLDGRRAVFLVNWTDAAQYCTFAEPLTALDGGPAMSVYTLPPRSGAVLASVRG